MRFGLEEPGWEREELHGCATDDQAPCIGDPDSDDNAAGAIATLLPRASDIRDHEPLREQKARHRQ
jgi:hypothetical protein